MSLKFYFRFAVLTAICVVAPSCSVSAHDNRLAVAQLETSSQRIALAAKDIALGRTEAFDTLRRTNDELESVPKEGLADFDMARKKLIDHAIGLIKLQQPLIQNVAKVSELDLRLRTLNACMKELKKILSEKEDSKSQEILAGRLEMLIDRMRRGMQMLLTVSSETQSPNDELQRDARLYSLTLKILSKREDGWDTNHAPSAPVREILGDIQQKWAEVERLIDDLLYTAPSLEELSQAVSDIQADSDLLVAQCNQVLDKLGR
jgi:hypothetical protein